MLEFTECHSFTQSSRFSLIARVFLAPAARRMRRASACLRRGSPRGPCRSTRSPISLAGFRLKTTTIVRPTSASGSYASAMPATIVRCSRADVHVQLQQLLGLRHALGGEHLGDAQLDLHEVVDGDSRCRPRSGAGCWAAGRARAGACRGRDR